MDDVISSEMSVTEVDYLYTLLPKGAYRHQMVCVIPEGLGDAETMEALREMHENPALEGFTEGKEYRWDGISAILFRDKAKLAQFRMFIP